MSSTPPEMPLAEDPRPAFAEASEVARTVFGLVSVDHGDRPTPSGMTVEELAPHLVMAIRRTALVGEGAPLETFPMDAEDVDLTNVAETLDKALTEAAAAWSNDETLSAIRALPWDPSTLGNEALSIYVNELVVHTWDVARGIDAPVAWSDETINVALAGMYKQLPIAERDPIWAAVAAEAGLPVEEFEAPMADATPVSEDASQLERLIAWNGRNF